jgi:hypothetical protein
MPDTFPDVPLSSVDTPTLNRATRSTALATDAVLEALGLVLDADGEQSALNPNHLLPALHDANDAIQRAHTLLLGVGASPVELPPRREIPLDRLDTPEARELLDLLTGALVVAEKVDASRGRLLSPKIETEPEESRGVDLAESVSEIVHRLRLEIFGPKGSGRE